MAQAQVPGKSASARTRKSTATTQTKQRTAAKKAPAKKSTVSPKKSAAPAAKGDKRHAMIAEIAFYYAEQRGFQGDMEMDDWLRAEAEVDALLTKKRKPKAG